MTFPYTKTAGYRVFAEYITIYYLFSIRAVVAAWLERECKESAAFIYHTIMVCLDRASLLDTMLKEKGSE